MKRVCMIVPNRMVKGGIAAVVNGYRGSQLEKDYEITYVESYKDGSKFDKLLKGICGYFHFAYVLMFHKPDVVHIHSSFGPSFYRKMPFIYMASWRKIPIVNHIHGADFDEFYVNAPEEKKAKIKKVYSLAVPEGTIMNGIITGEQRLQERLEQIWNRYSLPRKGICLVIDSGKIMTKMLEVPYMKDKELISCINKEFADGEKTDLVTDYFPFPKNSPYEMNHIFCAALEKSVIESYLSLFSDLKLKVKRISIGLGCLLRAVTATGMFAYETCVFMLVQGSTTISVLFENGNYIYSRRNRMLNDQGSAEWIEELGQIADGIRQFYRQRHSSYTLDSIYLAGIAGGSDDVVKELDTYMQEYGIRAKAPGMIQGISFVKTAVSDHGEINAEPASYIYGIGNLLL
mgnify:CR=1 FL=1